MTRTQWVWVTGHCIASFLMFKWHVMCGTVLFGKCLIKSAWWQEKAVAWKAEKEIWTSALLTALNPCRLKMQKSARPVVLQMRITWMRIIFSYMMSSSRLRGAIPTGNLCPCLALFIILMKEAEPGWSPCSHYSRTDWHWWCPLEDKRDKHGSKSIPCY